jgi:hypothetical protein
MTLFIKIQSSLPIEKCADMEFLIEIYLKQSPPTRSLAYFVIEKGKWKIYIIITAKAIDGIQTKSGFL